MITGWPDTCVGREERNYHMSERRKLESEMIREGEKQGRMPWMEVSGRRELEGEGKRVLNGTDEKLARIEKRSSKD